MKKVFAIFFTIITLASNAGVTFATHYCSGEAVSTGLGIMGLSQVDCGMENGSFNCASSSSEAAIKNLCCSNEKVQLSVEDSFESKLVSNRITQQFESFLLTSVLPNSFQTVKKIKTTNLELYLPPLLSYDISVLIQSFLI